MRRFDACSLCLQRARDPVACQDGHLFCKECVYTDLLKQKKDIKRQKERLETLKREAEEEKARAKATARERVLAEFERGQIGLAAKASITTSGKDSGEPRGEKRKFAFDMDAAEKSALEAEEAAARQIEREQAEALKAKLPDFWLPSLTPTYTSSGPPTSVKEIKLQTTCRGGNPPHSVSLKNLIPVKFNLLPSASGSGSGQASNQDDSRPMCLSCKKELSNSIRLFLMKTCSHVVCKTCTETLVKTSKQCTECDKVLDEKDIIELKREGTGFSGGGMAETSKVGIAFQG